MIGIVLLLALFCGVSGKAYLLLSCGEEEICNVELFYIRLLEFVTTESQMDIQMVEPFVCDSFIGGLPGWTFEASGLFSRSMHCPLKPYSWYRDIFASEKGQLLRKPIPYKDFAYQSNYCPKPPLSSDFTPGLLSGGCVEICIVAVADWSKSPDSEDMTCNDYELNQAHVIKNVDKAGYDVMDPFLKKPTSLSIVDFTCWHPQRIDKIGGIKALIELAKERKGNGECRTASVAIHRAGKGTFSQFYKGLYWHELESKYLDIPFGEELVSIAKQFHKQKLNGEKYIAVQLRALKPGVGGNIIDPKDEEGFRNCFKEIVITIKEQMESLKISKVFLTSDALSRNSTTWAGKEHELMLQNLFNEVILGSDIDFVINLESDEFAQRWKKDRGAQVLIDQYLSSEAQYAVVCGSGSVSKRIVDLRTRLGRPMKEIYCKASSSLAKPLVITNIEKIDDIKQKPLKADQVDQNDLLLHNDLVQNLRTGNDDQIGQSPIHPNPNATTVQYNWYKILGFFWLGGAILFYKMKSYFLSKVLLALSVLSFTWLLLS